MNTIVKEEVYDDLTNISQWYESNAPGLALNFLHDWEDSLKEVERNPYIFQIKFKNFRHCKLQKFPYLIIFEIEKNSIIVYAVIHGHRKPSIRYKKRK